MHPRHYPHASLRVQRSGRAASCPNCGRKISAIAKFRRCREFSQELEISSTSLRKRMDTRYTPLSDRASRNSQKPVGAVEGARNGTVAGHPTNNRVAVRGPL
jgi:hypothetical protein